MPEVGLTSEWCRFREQVNLGTLFAFIEELLTESVEKTRSSEFWTTIPSLWLSWIATDPTVSGVRTEPILFHLVIVPRLSGCSPDSESTKFLIVHEIHAPTLTYVGFIRQSCNTSIFVSE